MGTVGHIQAEQYLGRTSDERPTTEHRVGRGVGTCATVYGPTNTGTGTTTWPAASSTAGGAGLGTEYLDISAGYTAGDAGREYDWLYCLHGCLVWAAGDSQQTGTEKAAGELQMDHSTNQGVVGSQ